SWIMNQCLRKTNALQHAFGVSGQPPFARLAQIDEVEQFVYAFLEPSASQAAKTPKETQRFFASKVFVEVRILRQKTDCFPAFHKETVAPKNFRAAAGRGNQPENYFERCAFAGTIRSQQAVHFAWLDVKVQVLHGHNPAAGMHSNRKDFR